MFNILPRSDQRYNTGMKRLKNSFKFDNDNAAAFRLMVLQHAQKFGWKSACDAYNICRATYFNWQKAFNENGVQGLCAKSTKPHTYRQSKVHPLLVAYIKELRQDCGNIGSDKLKLFVDDYANQIGAKTISARTIDRIIAQYHLFETIKPRKVSGYPQINSLICSTDYLYGIELP